MKKEYEYVEAHGGGKGTKKNGIDRVKENCDSCTGTPASGCNTHTCTMYLTGRIQSRLRLTHLQRWTGDLNLLLISDDGDF